MFHFLWGSHLNHMITYFLKFFEIFFVINFPRLNYKWWSRSGVWVLNKDNRRFLYFKHNEYIINYYNMVFSHFIVQFHLACVCLSFMVCFFSNISTCFCWWWVLIWSSWAYHMKHLVIFVKLPLHFQLISIVLEHTHD